MGECTGVNVNARTNLFPPHNRINDRRMDAGSNKGTILRYPSSQDLIYLVLLQDMPLLPCAVLQQQTLFFLMPLYRFVQGTLSKAKHTILTHPLPLAGIKPLHLWCPFRRCFKGSFDVFWCYVFHIKRNSSGCDQQHCAAEDRLLALPPMPKNTQDNRDISLRDWKKEKMGSLWWVLHHDSRHSAHALNCLDSVIEND